MTVPRGEPVTVMPPTPRAPSEQETLDALRRLSWHERQAIQLLLRLDYLLRTQRDMERVAWQFLYAGFCQIAHEIAETLKQEPERSPSQVLTFTGSMALDEIAPIPAEAAGVAEDPADPADGDEQACEPAGTGDRDPAPDEALAEAPEAPVESAQAP